MLARAQVPAGEIFAAAELSSGIRIRRQGYPIASLVRGIADFHDAERPPRQLPDVEVFRNCPRSPIGAEARKFLGSRSRHAGPTSTTGAVHTPPESRGLLAPVAFRN